ncbi:MAG: acyl-CoA thioester hydrolase [Firmicutes bacterium]|nr:acyl-CoA thioester hydrolase [Bacillota bacterium]
MKKQLFRIETDGFNGAWYPAPAEEQKVPATAQKALATAQKALATAQKGIILMLGDSSEDYMAACGAKWLNKQGIHVLAMSPDKKDYGHHSYPLERFAKALAYMKSHGCGKFGIVGASTTGMLALVAASYYPELSLTVAISPSDFVMEGFYRDGKDGATERPGDFESSLSWQGQQLPFLPYAYRHPEYWQKIQEESKAGGDKIASRKMFDESERRHPIQEEERIKVERIHGRVICIGAEDDVLWDTCRYIRRMEERLATRQHESTFESWLYDHGTHFAFPESLLKMMLPIGSGLLVSMMFKAGKEHPKECRETRIDIDRRIRKVLAEW